MEEISDPLMKEIRYFDRLADALTKGKLVEKIMNNQKQAVYREIRNEIGMDEFNKLVIEAQGHNLLFHGITEQLLFSTKKYDRMDMSFLSKISSLDYGNKHRVLLIGSEQDLKKEILSKIEYFLYEKFNIYLTTLWEKLVICILPEKMLEISKIKELYYFIEKIAGNIKIAGSTIKYTLEDSHYGLQEAIRTYDMIETMKKSDENLMFYEDLGIFGLLYDLKESSVFETYCNGVFQDIWQYDLDNDSHLFQTLECYFKNECNKIKTAEELFIHENTLRYRLHQIEEILGKSLKNINVITDIVTAFKVRRMMQILDNV